MSYHLNEQKGKPIEIEMPPLPVEAATEIQEQEQEQATVDKLSTIEESTVDNLSTLAETPDPIEDKPVKKSTAPQESFKILKEKATRLQRERDEFERMLREVEVAKQMQQPNRPQPQQQEEEDITIGNEELVEGKHLSQYNKKLKKMEQQLQGYQQQAINAKIESKLRKDYKDFDNVVSAENIETLKLLHPEVAEEIASTNNLYSAGVTAYITIKNMGLDQQEDYKADVERIKKNAAKPRSLSSISPQQGDSPLSQANAFANGLTDELKKQLQKEMIAARRAM